MLDEHLMIRCRDCAATFHFPVDDQRFLPRARLASPVRCRGCRAIVKCRREECTRGESASTAAFVGELCGAPGRSGFRRR